MITRNRIVLSFKDSPRKPLRRRPKDSTAIDKRGERELEIGTAPMQTPFEAYIEIQFEI